MPPADQSNLETAQTHAPDLLSMNSGQLEQTAWIRGKQGNAPDLEIARGRGLKAYTDKAEGNSDGYKKLMFSLYQDYDKRIPRFDNVEPSPEDEVKRAKLLLPAERETKLAKLRSDLEKRLGGQAEIYAQAAGVFDSAANAQDIETMEALLTALPTMAADEDVADRVVDTVKKVDGKTGTAGMTQSLDYLRRMTVHYSGLSKERPDQANQLRQMAAPAEGYAASRRVFADPAKESGISLSGGKLSPKDWEGVLVPIFGEQSAITRYIESNHDKMAGQPTAPEFVGNALLMALNNSELVQQIGPQETDKLKLMLLGAAEYVLDNSGEGNAIDRRVTKAAELVYGVCGEQTLAEVANGNGVLAEKFKAVANRAGEALKVVDPKISGSGTEALSQKFAGEENAKTEKAQAAAQAVAAEQKLLEETLAAAAKKAEEEETKAAIEKTAVDLRAGLGSETLWKPDKSFLGKPKGTYSPTPAWQEQFGRTSNEINELKALPELNPDQRIRLTALEQHSRWLSGGSKPA